MKKNQLFAALFVLIAFQSCISMQSVTISDVKQSKGTQVTASRGALGVLSLSVPKGIVEKATEDLKQGGVTGNVSTSLTLRNWFVVQYYRVVAVGYTEK